MWVLVLMLIQEPPRGLQVTTSFNSGAHPPLLGLLRAVRPLCNNLRRGGWQGQAGNKVCLLSSGGLCGVLGPGHVAVLVAWPLRSLEAVPGVCSSRTGRVTSQVVAGELQNLLHANLRLCARMRSCARGGLPVPHGLLVPYHLLLDGDYCATPLALRVH